MLFFIDFLKALATCLITNSHYTGIYPTDLIANGGLIGDILFFAVSGYCLYEVRASFFKWYGKRVFRCYLSVILITVLYLILGFYTTEEHTLFWWIFYPTTYHFVASIVVLYIPYYWTMKLPSMRRRLPLIMLGIFIGAVLWYLLGYDRSYYHIDNVREPMIRVLFFESMLLGAWFRQNDSRFRGHSQWWHILIAFLLLCGYFVSKLIFSKLPAISEYQLVNQLLIFALLFSLFRTAAGASEYLDKLPGIAKRIIRGLSRITLEIYVVQYVLIDLVRPLFAFPINWIVLTTSILIAANILNRVCSWISKVLTKRIREV